MDDADLTVVVIGGELCDDAAQCQERGNFGEILTMIIDTILQYGITLSVYAGMSFQHNGATIGHYEMVPYEQHATLSELNTVVVPADEVRSLRHELDASGRAIIDVLCSLCDDLTRKIGTDIGYKHN